MFRLEHPLHLLGWLAIPILLLMFLFMIYSRRRMIAQLGNASILKQMMPRFSKPRQWIKFGLVGLGLFFLCLSWANPQWGTKREKVKRKSSDVFIAIDISNSMNATDIAPSRLERAKKFARKLVEKLEGDRVGVIVFAGNSYVHMPLTIDYSAAGLFLDSANPSMILTQGTSIRSAINLAELAFEQDNDEYKALIIISDGENHEPQALEKAKDAHEKGMLIYTVGTGTAAGGYVPVSYGGYSDFKRDKTGALVRSKLNEEMLQQVAEAGGGKYYNVTAGDEAVLNSLKERIKEIEKREFEQRMFDEYESYFWIFLIPGLLFLVIEFLISYRRSNIISGKDIFS